MIVVDTSALMSILLGEPEADRCSAVLADSARLLISAGTVAEALIVAERRGVGREVREVLDRLGIEVVDVTASHARLIADLYRRWGKSLHPAGLNFGDCFALALATDRRCGLLYVGDDFAKAGMPSLV